MAKWKYQCWKSPPIWDSVILQRPFAASSIRSMKCYDSTFILILSNDTNIEIWNVKNGNAVYSKSFVDKIEYIDFFEFYQHDVDKDYNNIGEWTIFLANKSGLIMSSKCNLKVPDQLLYNTQINSITNCFLKSIANQKTIILVGTNIDILNCDNFSLLMNIANPFSNEISCLLVTDDIMVVASDKYLWCLQISINIELKIEWKLNNKSQYHKNNIIDLIDIDENYFASISIEVVKIWKKPEFNIIKIFTPSDDLSRNVNEKSIICILSNSRYLVVSFYCGFAIFDCINGSTLAKVTEAHETKIIGIEYLNYLSTLLTISEDGISRLWAFQLCDSGLDPIKSVSASPMQKTLAYSNFFSFSASRNAEEKQFLGKSPEKGDKESQPLNCYLELRHTILSKNHLVNLEEIGIVTSDGTANLILWRNRDYAFNGLIKLLQN